MYAHYLSAIVLQMATLALLLAWAWPRRSAEPKPRLPALLFIGYGLVALLLVIRAPAPGLSLIGTIQIVFPLACGLLLSRMLRKPEDLRLLLRLIVVAGTLAAAVALALVLDRSENSAEWQLGVVEQVIGHRNFLAIFLLPPLALCAAELFHPLLYPENRHRPLNIYPWLAVLAANLMAGALLLCTSIGAILATGAVILFLGARRLSGKWRRALIVLILVAMVAVFVILSLQSVEERILPQEKAQRWFMWKGAVRMALERPILGWGPGMFTTRFAEYKPTAPMRYGWLSQFSLYPHNEYLLVAVETGLLGLLLYLGGFVTAFRRALRSAENDASCGPLIWAVGAGLVGMLAQGFVTISLRFWAPMMLFWVLAGILIAAPRLAETRPAGKPKAASRTWNSVRIVLAFFVAGVLLWQVVWPGAVAEWLIKERGRYRLVRRRLPRGQVEMYFIRYDIPQVFGGAGVPISNEEYVRFYVNDMEHGARLSRYLPDKLIAMRKKASKLQGAQRYRESLEAFKELEQVSPAHGAVRAVIADTAVKLARRSTDPAERSRWYEEARTWHHKCFEQNPYNYSARLNFAEMLVTKKPTELDRAVEQLEVIAEAPPLDRYDDVRRRTLDLIDYATRSAMANDIPVPDRLSALAEQLRQNITTGQPAEESSSPTSEQ